MLVENKIYFILQAPGVIGLSYWVNAVIFAWFLVTQIKKPNQINKHCWHIIIVHYEKLWHIKEQATHDVPRKTRFQNKPFMYEAVYVLL